jgi:hypothetical protein
VRILGLAEPGFELFLGAVGVDDLGEGPVVVVGDQDPFAEDLLLEGLWVPETVRTARDLLVRPRQVPGMIRWWRCG